MFPQDLSRKASLILHCRLALLIVVASSAVLSYAYALPCGFQLTNAPTECNGSDHWLPVSVAGHGTHCTQGPICAGAEFGACPEPNADIPYGSKCTEVAPSVYGCVPRHACHEDASHASVAIGDHTTCERGCAIDTSIPTTCNGEHGWNPVSVVGQGTFCVRGPICVAAAQDACPEPQRGLPFGSSCTRFTSGTFGCVPNTQCESLCNQPRLVPHRPYHGPPEPASEDDRCDPAELAPMATTTPNGTAAVDITFTPQTSKTPDLQETSRPRTYAGAGDGDESSAWGTTSSPQSSSGGSASAPPLTPSLTPSRNPDSRETPDIPRSRPPPATSPPSSSPVEISSGEDSISPTAFPLARDIFKTPQPVVPEHAWPMEPTSILETTAPNVPQVGSQSPPPLRTSESVDSSSEPSVSSPTSLDSRAPRPSHQPAQDEKIPSAPFGESSRPIHYESALFDPTETTSAPYQQVDNDKSPKHPPRRPHA